MLLKNRTLRFKSLADFLTAFNALAMFDSLHNDAKYKLIPVNTFDMVNAILAKTDGTYTVVGEDCRDFQVVQVEEVFDKPRTLDFFYNTSDLRSSIQSAVDELCAAAHLYITELGDDILKVCYSVETVVSGYEGTNKLVALLDTINVGITRDMVSDYKTSQIEEPEEYSVDAWEYVVEPHFDRLAEMLALEIPPKLPKGVLYRYYYSHNDNDGSYDLFVELEGKFYRYAEIYDKGSNKLLERKDCNGMTDYDVDNYIQGVYIRMNTDLYEVREAVYFTKQQII